MTTFADGHGLCIMFEDFKAKIERLIARYEAVKNENAVLAEKLRQSEEKAIDQRKRITELEKSIDDFKLTVAFLGTTEQKDVAIHRIDKLIREIDKCIALIED